MIKTNYHRWNNLSLQQLGQSARRLGDDQPLRASQDGVTLGRELPLTAGEFRQALGEIQSRQGWLTDRPGVSLYQDMQKQIHLDVINYGGFVLGPGGHVLAQSINPW